MTMSARRAALFHPARGNPRGFTLTELLVVIVIIAILLALLTPAVFRAVVTTREAAVTSDIQVLGQALAAFKNQYGEFPPSRLVLSEENMLDSSYDTQLLTGSIPWAFAGAGVRPGAADLSFGALRQRSLSALRKYFPRVPYGPTSPTLFTDFNGNGIRDTGWMYLEGHECLVFFLGGIPAHSNTITMTGFGKDPTNPFVNNTVVPSNRTAPFTELRSNRLIDDDGDFFPGYIDTLAAGNDGRFYAYFSGYGNNAYDPNDCNYPPADPFGVDPQGINNQIPFRVSFAAPSITNRLVLSWGPNPYTSTLNVTNAVTQQPASFLNPQSYQIISAGVDRRFGVGGNYDPDSNALKIPQPVSDVLAPLDTVDVTGTRLDRLAAERDNLTNFATGKLD